MPPHQQRHAEASIGDVLLHDDVAQLRQQITSLTQQIAALQPPHRDVVTSESADESADSPFASYPRDRCDNCRWENGLGLDLLEFAGPMSVWSILVRPYMMTSSKLIWSIIAHLYMMVRLCLMRNQKSFSTNNFSGMMASLLCCHLVCLTLNSKLHMLARLVLLTSCGAGVLRSVAEQNVVGVVDTRSHEKIRLHEELKELQRYNQSLIKLDNLRSRGETVEILHMLPNSVCNLNKASRLLAPQSEDIIKAQVIFYAPISGRPYFHCEVRETILIWDCAARLLFNLRDADDGIFPHFLLWYDRDEAITDSRANRYSPGENDVDEAETSSNDSYNTTKAIELSLEDVSASSASPFIIDQPFVTDQKMELEATEKRSCGGEKERVAAEEGLEEEEALTVEGSRTYCKMAQILGAHVAEGGASDVKEEERASVEELLNSYTRFNSSLCYLYVICFSCLLLYPY